MQDDGRRFMSDERDKQLEKLLDSALANYGVAEPLRGLEERVLGRLEGERSRRPWWMWAAVAVGAMAVLVMALLMRQPEQRKPAIEAQHHPQTTAPKQSVTPSQSEPASVRTQKTARAAVKHLASRQRMVAAVVNPAAVANGVRPRNAGAAPVVIAVVNSLPK